MTNQMALNYTRDIDIFYDFDQTKKMIWQSTMLEMHSFPEGGNSTK
jgi:hypothetical protein